MSDRVLISLSTPIHPNPEQAAWLQHCLATGAAIDTLLRGAGRHSRDPAAVSRLAAQVSRTLDLRDSVPPSLVRGAVSRAVHAGTSRDSASVPLDEAVVALDPYHICIEGVEAPLLADVWRLPLRLSAVLLRDGAQVAQACHQHYAAWAERDAAGTTTALSELHMLARRHAALLVRPIPAAPASHPQVERTRHATLRRYRQPDGRDGWAVTWALRVPPDWLPRASVDDTVGIDVGVHRLVTWVSADDEGHVPAPPLPTGCWQPPGGISSPLSDAMVRQVQFARRAAQLDEALRMVLRYRGVAVEATNWRGLAGSAELEGMSLSGVTEWRYWLTALSRVTGSRVVAVPAWRSSHRCGWCAAEGHREGRVFCCPEHGLADADTNAARYHRRLGLRMLRGLRS